MSDSTPHPDREPDPPRDADAPVLPGTWSARRVGLCLLLAAHWLAVLAYALPDDAAPAGVPLGRWSRAALDWEMPIPVLDTHRDRPLLSIERESPVLSYLTLSAQSQRWKMFTPRRELASVITLEYQMEDGSTRLVRLADPQRMSRLRWLRWRLLEWTLMSDSGIRRHVPHCALPLARHLAPGPWQRVTIRKRFVPIPVLRESERAPNGILFTRSQDHLERTGDLSRMRIATFPNLVVRNPDLAGSARRDREPR